MDFSEEDIEEFKIEAFELLDVAEASLLDLDGERNFEVCFDRLFRSLHNLKGSAGMMELLLVQEHTHKLETTLMSLKDEMKLDQVYIDYFLRGVDETRLLLNGDGGAFDYNVDSSTKNNELIITDSQKTDTIHNSTHEQFPIEMLEEFVCDSFEIVERISLYLEVLENGSSSFELLDSLYREVHTLKGNSYLFSHINLGKLTHQMETSLEPLREGSMQIPKELINCLYKCLSIIELGIKAIKSSGSDSCISDVVNLMVNALGRRSEVFPESEQVEHHQKNYSESVDGAKDTLELKMEEVKDTQEKPKDPASSSIRVPVPLLDSLMTLVGEMVLVRNQVLQYSNASDNTELVKMSKKLNTVTTEIQEEMMKTRMQPIGHLLQKFNRVVRDLSSDLGKKIKLNLIGADTELDKTLLEAIKDPLTHIVRNSCDHGVEKPEVRLANGKSEEGNISISAFHEGGQVIIEITDDGKGLDIAALVEKAISKDVLTKEAASNISDKDAFNLIFAPGFSTAEKVTNVSGRGVGMDVVKTNIEAIGGTIDLSGDVGVGTTIRIKIPLTLAIIPALLVSCRQTTFAIPQVKLEELVRIEKGNSDHKIEFLHGEPVCKIRGNIVPLVDMNNVLKFNDKKQESYDNSIHNIIILGTGNTSFGLIVDRIQDTADIVVKPLNKLLKSLEIYSGATILGDGSIALIFDVVGISKVANITNKSVNKKDTLLDDIHIKEEKNLLLFRIKAKTKHAIALSYVERLEEFKYSDLEYSGGHYLVRYGDVILPLVCVSESLLNIPFESFGDDSDKKIYVIVIEKRSQFYGLVVEEIFDTLSTRQDLELPLDNNKMIFGHLNMKDELIVVLNPFQLINEKFPQEISQNIQKEELVLIEDCKTILLVEDTVFFQKTIGQILNTAGYSILLAQNGKEALKVISENDHIIDLVISDIEMPYMGGLELARAIRDNKSFDRVPLIAISSKADKEAIKRGLDSGFNIYLEKLCTEDLLDAIKSVQIEKRQTA